MITKKTEYAIRAMVELARDPDITSTANRIAQHQEIPPKYFPQIVSELSRAGLLTSVRGYGGGIRLGRPAREISLLNIIEATQGSLAMFECQDDNCDCAQLPNCKLKTIYNKAQSSLETVFRETKLSDIRFK